MRLSKPLLTAGVAPCPCSVSSLIPSALDQYHARAVQSPPPVAQVPPVCWWRCRALPIRGPAAESDTGSWSSWGSRCARSWRVRARSPRSRSGRRTCPARCAWDSGSGGGALRVDDPPGARPGRPGQSGPVRERLAGRSPAGGRTRRAARRGAPAHRGGRQDRPRGAGRSGPGAAPARGARHRHRHGAGPVRGGPEGQ